MQLYDMYPNLIIIRSILFRNVKLKSREICYKFYLIILFEIYEIEGVYKLIENNYKQHH